MKITYKGENVGNTIKLVSGFVLFVIGLLIAYETIIFNLSGILLIVSIVISIVGLIMIVSYFMDSNAVRTTNMIKEFMESNNNGVPSFRGLDKNKKPNGPLRMQNDYYQSNTTDFRDFSREEFSDFSEDDYYGDEDYKSVLNVEPQRESVGDFNKQLKFTPNYDKPLKVTRTPKKRDTVYNEIPDIAVETSKSEEIRRALAEDEIIVQHDEDTQSEVSSEVASNREIKIDINNPDSLPVPKSLNSYIISDGGLLTSKEAFDNLAVHVNKEIMLEIPSLNDLSDRFLSHVPTIYSRVIINEFDISDMSYMFLISSLIKQGVHIKTVPQVHSINLITDDSHAMIISEGKDEMEYGAIYNDRTSISNIRADFEKTWNIASNLDDNIVLNSANGGVV